MVTDIINTLHIGDARIIIPTLPKKSIQTVITSPPYFQLRDYGINGQIGQEETVEDYIDHLIDIFSKIKCVLKDDGTVWLNQLQIAELFQTTKKNISKHIKAIL